MSNSTAAAIPNRAKSIRTANRIPGQSDVDDRGIIRFGSRPIIRSMLVFPALCGKQTF